MELVTNPSPTPSNGHLVSDAATAHSAATLTLVERPASDRFEAVPAGGVGEWLEDDVTAEGVRLSLMSSGGDHCIATAVVTPAEHSRFQAISGVAPAALGTTVVLSGVRFDPARADEVLPALFYFAIRRARIWGRGAIATYVARDARGADTLRLERLTQLPSRAALEPAAQRVDLAIYAAYKAASDDMKALIRPHFVGEAVETVERWVEHFFQTPWYNAVYAGTLTKQQYIYTISQLHQFVRYTTRLIGRAVSHSTDRALRNHWLKHLTGEINHEQIIEKDLANLGADVAYVTDSMAPMPAIRQFMAGQESSVGFYDDPVALAASPFVAEKFSAAMGQRFIDALDANVRSWGIAKPAHVTSFLRSHIEFDGAGDDHWLNTRIMLERHITEEAKLEQMLSLIKLSMDAFEQAFTRCEAELAIFGAKPTSSST